MKWDVVIGLEIHAQLNTKTKLFCSCATSFGQEANLNTCPVCLGHPGKLPVLNEAALKKAIQLGLATESSISLNSYFERKNYFYPDLPKAYQITQLENPICKGGKITIQINDNNQSLEKDIHLERIQIEEDAGKLMHSQTNNVKESYVDLNRAGTPLLEIVSKPEISSAIEAVDFFKKIRSLLLYLEISDGNMQEGSLRCDANVSIKPKGEKELGNRTEIKNMNTFKGIQMAIEYEINRQITLKKTKKLLFLKRYFLTIQLKKLDLCVVKKMLKIIDIFPTLIYLQYYFLLILLKEFEHLFQNFPTKSINVFKKIINFLLMIH